MVPPRVVLALKQKQRLKAKFASLPTDGASGEWEFSVSENGWVKADTFLEIIQDVGDFIKKNDIPTPVLLFFDGATVHLSLEASKLCNELGIQPILLRPNCTHLMQALDLTFFSSLKAVFKRRKEAWHRDPANVGQALNKYSVVYLLQQATEECLQKPGLIARGFRKAGIVPWDPSAPTKDRMQPSLVYSRSNSALAQPGAVEPAGAETSATGQPLLAAGQGETAGQTGHGAATSTTTEASLGTSTSTSEASLKTATVMEAGVDTAEVTNTEVEAGPVEASPEKPIALEPAASSHKPKPASCPSKLPVPDLKEPVDLVDPDTQGLPECSPWFLAKWELVLSAEQLGKFNSLYAARKFDVDNAVYQAWLGRKKASLPQAEREALQQVQTVLHRTLHCTALHTHTIFVILHCTVLHCIPKLLFY